MRCDVIETTAEIFSSSSVVGGKESEGPLGELFDLRDPSNRFGMKTWESAESEMQRLAMNTALAKGGVRAEEVGALFAGDLLNQCIGSAYGLQSFDIPYIGLYGACSTCAESLLLSSLLVSHGIRCTKSTDCTVDGYGFGRIPCAKAGQRRAYNRGKSSHTPMRYRTCAG